MSARRGFHTLIRNASFSSPTDVGSHRNIVGDSRYVTRGVCLTMFKRQQEYIFKMMVLVTFMKVGLVRDPTGLVCFI